LGIIKTVNEVVHERMNECVGVLVKRFMKSVRPIYGSTERGTPHHIGSCVLLEINKKKYLVTAAHVIDHNEITTLYVSGSEDLVQITAKAIMSKSDNNNRNDDKLDFAILPLSDCILSKLEDVVFLNESDMLCSDSQKDGNLYLALGFPNSKNKKIDNINKKVTQNPFVYSSTLKTQLELFNEIGAKPDFHYLLDFCGKHSKDENNNVVNSISPVGASGGALFFIEGMNNPENYRQSSDCSGKLVGILIENHKKQKIIMATKISVVKRALTIASFQN
jgi:hypothetical protein